MKTTYTFYAILVFGVIASITTPHILRMIYSDSSVIYKSDKQNEMATTVQNIDNSAEIMDEASSYDVAIALPELKEEKKEEVKEEEVKNETQSEEVVVETPVVPVKSYEEMTTEELINAIKDGTFKLEYSNIYETQTTRLSKAKGAIYYNNHKETYYSEKTLPGASLRISGRHVADDGTIRDSEGYIAVAANSAYLSKGTIVKTSLGPGKVYDSGCASGIVDLYTNW